MHAARALVPVRVLSVIVSRLSRRALFRSFLPAFFPAFLGAALHAALSVGALALTAGIARATPPPGTTLNACGCYRDDSGVCFCEKKSKCGCEGECEPKGCEEKRAKEREKELENEVKLAKQRGGAHDKADEGSRGKTRASEKAADDEAPSRKAGKPEPKRSSTDDGSGAMCPPCPCAEGKAKATKSEKAAKSEKKPKASEAGKDLGK